MWPRGCPQGCPRVTMAKDVLEDSTSAIQCIHWTGYKTTSIGKKTKMF